MPSKYLDTPEPRCEDIRHEYKACLVQRQRIRAAKRRAGVLPPKGKPWAVRGVYVEEDGRLVEGCIREGLSYPAAQRSVEAHRDQVRHSRWFEGYAPSTLNAVADRTRIVSECPPPVRATGIPLDWHGTVSDLYDPGASKRERTLPMLSGPKQGSFRFAPPVREASKPLRVLVACEHTGTVRDAFRRLGHDAVSVDLLPTTAPGPHIQGDVLDHLNAGWDLMVAHPPCTYLAASGLHWNKRVPGREKKTREALDFVRQLMRAPIPRIAIENPQGRISTAIRPADQYIQPYDFGADASKKTGLWLKGLPPLVPSERVPGRRVKYKGRVVERWANQTDGGQNKCSPSPDRWAIRSATYPGIAEEMARQWGGKVKR